MYVALLMKPRSETHCIISLDWLIADSTAGRRNGFPHLWSERAGKYARRLWWRMARIRREKRVKSWLHSARFIADFFAHWRVRRRLISSSAEAISMDSKPKLRSRINSLDMTWNRDLSDANWITQHAFSSILVTCNHELVRSWLIACYMFVVCWLKSCL